ncbi:MAG: RdgB/HAM1 family non-canonical purine NTP pyrophosphatase [Planctomycetota bacterium]
MKLLLATGNPKKRIELQRILASRQFEVVTPGELGLDLEPEENGRTFDENSLIKARAFAALVDGPVLADDSGLEVDALNGAPGVHSARFAGPECDDAENRARLLADLDGVPPARRTARFVCVLALVRGVRVLARIRGTCEGRILDREQGQGGFGYDCLFFHEQTGKTFAELDPDEKDLYSHRGVALRELTHHLDRIGSVL